ncbi:MAG: hypothetical protein ACXV5T_08700 [Halobacteriota archaeon]
MNKRRGSPGGFFQLTTLLYSRSERARCEKRAQIILATRILIILENTQKTQDYEYNYQHDNKP